MNTMTWTTHTRPAAAAVAIMAIGLSGCGDALAPPAAEDQDAVAETLDYPLAPVQAVYSLSPGSLQTLQDEPLSEATAGDRWCSYENVWVDTEGATCSGVQGDPPFGDVQVVEDSEIVLDGGYGHAAPFLWTGPPGRDNPFPDTGDFNIEVRVQAEQLEKHDMGLSMLDWDPASTTGDNTPFADRVFQIWARSRDGVRVILPDAVVNVADPLAEHVYRLEYADGAYTLYVDGERAAGPIASEWRPKALWVGTPSFARYPGTWTDLRVSQFTVTTPAEAALEVPVDIKPGGCPSPINLQSRGVLPVAIMGTSELDVSQIDVSTLRLGSAPPAPERSSLEDVGSPVEPYIGKTAESCSDEDPDGIVDLTLKFSNSAIAEALSEDGDPAPGEERTLALTGNLLPEHGGTPILGEDVIVIRGSNKP